MGPNYARPKTPSRAKSNLTRPRASASSQFIVVDRWGGVHFSVGFPPTPNAVLFQFSV
jgi:hypothetical protein